MDVTLILNKFGGGLTLAQTSAAENMHFKKLLKSPLGDFYWISGNVKNLVYCFAPSSVDANSFSGDQVHYFASMR